MKAIRPKLAALLLTALLAALVLLPPHLALMQDKLLFGTLHTSDVPESAAEPSALSPPEKLAMICELYTDGLGLTTVSQTQLTPDPALAAKAQAALDALAEAGLLPPLDLYRDALAGAPCALSTAADLAAAEITERGLCLEEYLSA